MNTLDWAIRYAGKKGLVTRLVTNGWWAENYEEAFKFLSKLKDAGLNELNMSFGEFHLPYLKDEMKLVYAIKSAQDLGLRCAVANVQTRNSKINVPYIINLLKKEKIDTSKVLFVTDYVAPTGRGRLIPEELLVRGNRPDEIGCFEILKALSIHPNGDIHLCCGQAMLEIPELLGGNIKNDSIVEVITKAQKNLLYWWLFAKGPKGIIEEITGKSDKYVNICDACRILFAKHRKELYKKIENEKYEILLHDIIESDF
ncbi:hypothetical protein DRN58_02610 [Thermococci archaeon]|nr:MAG: hypothetical protein DRN58_02610 [Thermococci archaeon]